MVDYQVAQVSRWPVRNTPLGVLLDPERDPGRYAKVLPSADPNRLNVEARDPKHPEYGVMTLSFRRDPSGPSGLILRGWTVLDAQNNRTTVILSNQRFNVPVSDNNFSYREPRPHRPPDRQSTRLNSSHSCAYRMPSPARKNKTHQRYRTS